MMIGRSGRREPVPAEVRRPDALGRRREDPDAGISVGARPDRQLRAADRARRGLAAADPRRRRDAQIFDRRGAARQATIRPRCIGRTSEPILAAKDQDREGYVPNVVYSCGAIRHGDTLFMPYGIADSSVGFAFVPITDLLRGDVTSLGRRDAPHVAVESRRPAPGTAACRRSAPAARTPSPTSASGASLLVRVDDAREGDAPQALADDHAGRGQHAHALARASGSRRASGPAVVERADHRADHHRQRHRHRQIDAEADAERRQAQLARRGRAPRRATITPTPTSAPQPIIAQLRSPPSTPLASAEISAACGAASAFGPGAGRAGEAEACVAAARAPAAPPASRRPRR